ncbi:2,3-bisphosphoglycerate-independent phosphoglycerate mutase [Nosema bombycis CQ1]|uniref:2,3-bisphosphoglycerate-independent phosphoglycerate mutase n=1 Tax=Nosema bombycis (strain CQ1 / CVCC 102059) TaxID=578461 RepID=R0M6U0_NOSB1|nr:2,3-bisphosphoglycerate-independent phosphoglycerate mutase [Nosema bombycis CQ1]|eukprot:EOB13719.1 2,3-bisphosphoglycerate-independent phosphoglycerate mutase [Nosema bombycis CQ1]
MRQIVDRFVSNGNKIFTMVEFKKNFPVEVLYKQSVVKNTLSEVLSSNNISHSHIAESEKYAHVTYFFNGGNEKQFKHEKRFIIDSPKVKSFDEKPEMSSEKITETIMQEIDLNRPSIIANFASPDMVGHTGNYDAALQAIAKLDECIGTIYNKCQEKDYVLLITADHGNAEVMFDTELNVIAKKHTNNKVPFIICNKEIEEKDGDWGYIDSEFTLSDVAPTILSLYGIDKPSDMTGNSVL